MKIGVPKEIKPQEARVGLTPAGALTLIQSGHQVSVQMGLDYSVEFLMINTLR